MSAIWGIIDFKNNSVSTEDCRAMEAPFLKKKIDTIQTLCRGPVFMACGLQYVSDEAKLEQYPYRSENSCMVADAILDNRQELQQSFVMKNPLSFQGVDGSILFDCLEENVARALDTMLGAFVFAHYSTNAKILTLGDDVTGTRSVYYMVQDGRFYFSSLLEPLLAFQPERRRNDHWFFNFYAQDSLCFVNECRETPYQGIYRLEPGEVLTFSEEGLKRKAYWDPLTERKELKLPSHEAYAEKVREVFGAAVRRTLRKDQDAAILLSGGLDSNAVAAYAGPALLENGKKLYSFTSVPDADHPRPIEREYYVADERSYVELLKQYHPNLICQWIGCNHFDYLSESRKAIDILEFPYKTIPNMPWMIEAYHRAYECGCSTLLTGQYGNITISVGNFENLFETLLKGGRFLELNRQARAYGRVYRRSRRWIFRTLLKSIRPKYSNDCDKNGLAPLYYSQNKQELKALKGKPYFFSNAMCNLRPYMYDKNALRQVGESELKISLETGVIPRDPTRDKQLIELVMSLPVEELCWNGTDRMLVRQDMEGLIPNEILKDVFHRGQQAVGADEYLWENWPQIREVLRKELKTEHAEYFLNLPYFLEQLDLPEIDQEEDTVKMVRMIYCGLCSEYLGSHYDK